MQNEVVSVPYYTAFPSTPPAVGSFTIYWVCNLHAVSVCMNSTQPTGTDHYIQTLPDLRSFNLRNFRQIKKYFSSTRTENFLTQAKAQWGAGDGRILLVDNIDGWAAILRPIMFQCFAVWISTGLPFIYVYIVDHMYTSLWLAQNSACGGCFRKFLLPKSESVFAECLNVPSVLPYSENQKEEASWRIRRRHK
jgi:hypothetical protein